jgi:hypothetical protein
VGRAEKINKEAAEPHPQSRSPRRRRGPSSTQDGQAGVGPNVDPSRRGGERKAGITRLGLSAYILALLVLVVDQLSKFWILDRIFPARCPGFVADAAANTGCSVELLPSCPCPWSGTGASASASSRPMTPAVGSWPPSPRVAIALAIWARRLSAAPGRSAGPGHRRRASATSSTGPLRRGGGLHRRVRTGLLPLGVTTSPTAPSASAWLC